MTQTQQWRQSAKLTPSDDIDALAGGRVQDSKSPPPTQPESFPDPRSWTGAAETSAQAAQVAKSHLSETCKSILAIIRERGDATCEELYSIMCADGWAGLLNTVRARCCDLRKSGILRDSGRRGIGESGKTKVCAWELVSTGAGQ